MNKAGKIKEFRATLKSLEEQRAELVEEMENILAKAKEEQRAMSEDEAKEFDDVEAKIKAIDATIDAEKRALAAKPKKEQKKQEERGTEDEDAEVRAFEEFIRGNASEIRAGEVQLTQGLNGKIVPTKIANRIIKAVKDTVPYLQYADVTYTNGTLSIPVYGEDATNYIKADYVDEGDPLSDNIGKFTTVDLTGFVIGALALVSNKLITNTDINISDFVVAEVARALSEKLEQEFTIGTNNKITGVVSAPVRVTTTSQTAITYDELLTLKHSIKKRFRSNAKWIMNDDTYTDLCKLKDGNGQPYFKDDEYKILGCEVLITDSMATIAAGAKPIVFGDLSGYTIKGAKNIEINVLREKYADRNMLGVIGYAEFDAKISDAKKLSVLQMHA